MTQHTHLGHEVCPACILRCSAPNVHAVGHSVLLVVIVRCCGSEAAGQQGSCFGYATLQHTACRCAASLQHVCWCCSSDLRLLPEPIEGPQRIAALHAYHCHLPLVGLQVSPSFNGHSGSVEDLQWSPTEATVFSSCSTDKTIAVFDTRDRNKAQLQVRVDGALGVEVESLCKA